MPAEIHPRRHGHLQACHPPGQGASSQRAVHVVGAQRARRGDKAPRESESWGVLSTGLPSPQRCDGNGRVAGSPKERMVFRELKKKKKNPNKKQREMLMVLCKKLKISRIARVCWFFSFIFFPPIKECATQIKTISLQPARQAQARRPSAVSERDGACLCQQHASPGETRWGMAGCRDPAGSFPVTGTDRSEPGSQLGSSMRFSNATETSTAEVSPGHLDCPGGMQTKSRCLP